MQSALGTKNERMDSILTARLCSRSTVITSTCINALKKNIVFPEKYSEICRNSITLNHPLVHFPVTDKTLVWQRASCNCPIRLVRNRIDKNGQTLPKKLFRLPLPLLILSLRELNTFPVCSHSGIDELPKPQTAHTIAITLPMLLYDLIMFSSFR